MKNLRARLVSATLFAATVLAVCLQAENPPWPPATDLPPDPAVISGRLDNGMVYAVLANDEPRERASLRLMVRAGSLDETDDERGLAHYLEHMAFNGTRRFPADTLVEYFQRQGMSFGADTNANTGFERTMYMLELRKGDTAALTEALSVLRDFADGMLIEPSEVAKERPVILSEMRARDSVEFRTVLNEYEFILPDSRVPDRFPIGVEETLKAADAQRLRAFYERWYRPDNMAVVIVGDIDATAAVGLIKAAFESFRTEKPETARTGPGSVRSTDVPIAAVHAEAEASTVTVAIELADPWTKHPDSAAERMRDLPLEIACAIINRRLDKLSKDPDAPFTRGSTDSGTMLDFVRVTSIELTGAPDRWRDSLAIADQEIRRALEHGFSPAEVREITANVINAFEEAVRAAPTRRSPGLASGLASAILDGRVFTTPDTELAIVRPAIDRITSEACVIALREAWSASAPKIFVSGRLAPETNAAEVIDVYRDSLTVDVAPPEAQSEEPFAYTDFGPAGTVESRTHVEDLDVTLVRFSNGVRLNLKRTDFAANSISLRARLGGGTLELPPGRPELAMVAAPLINNSGLGRHTIEELRRILAGRTVGVSVGFGEDATEFSGSTSPKDLELEFQLLCALIIDPAARENVLPRLRKGMEQSYERMLHLPAGIARMRIPPLLASGDPRFGVPPLERALGVTPEEVIAWIRPMFADGAIEVAVVGDIDIEETIAIAARTLGALPPRDHKPAFTEARKVSYPDVAPRAEYIVDTEIQKALVLTYWPTDDGFDIGRMRRLSLLAAVFGDRLRKVIREELGAAYSPSASSSPSQTYPDYGLLSVSVEVAPEQAATVQEAVMRIADDLRENGVTEDELDRARQPRMTALHQAVRQNSYWIGSVLGDAQEDPESLENARTMISDYESVTKAGIDALARAYLDNTRAARFVVLPAEVLPAADAPAEATAADPAGSAAPR